MGVQEKSVKLLKALCPEYDAIHTHLYQDVLDRLDKAFRHFFARHKAELTGGFPRFKGFGRYHAFTFKDASHGNGVRLVDKEARRASRPAFPEVVGGGKRLQLSGIGKVKMDCMCACIGARTAALRSTETRTRQEIFMAGARPSWRGER